MQFQDFSDLEIEKGTEEIKRIIKEVRKKLGNVLELAQERLESLEYNQVDDFVAYLKDLQDKQSKEFIHLFSKIDSSLPYELGKQYTHLVSTMQSSYEDQISLYIQQIKEQTKTYEVLQKHSINYDDLYDY